MNNYFSNHIKIFSAEITLHKPIKDENIRVIHGTVSNLYFIDVDDIPENLRVLPYVPLAQTNIPRTLHHTRWARLYADSKEWLVYPYLNIISEDEMEREVLQTIRKRNYLLENPDIWNSSTMIIRLEKSPEEIYTLNYYINKQVVNNVKNNKRDTRADYLQHFLILNKRNQVIDLALSKINSLLDRKAPIYDLTDETNESMKNASLFKYQKQDIAWMRKIEHNVLTNNNVLNIEYPLVYSMLEDHCMIYNTSTAMHLSGPNASFRDIKHKYPLRYFGGNIVSETGLGKTIIALSRIFEDKPNRPLFTEHCHSCSYFFKRGASRGKFCSKPALPNQYYCKTHQHTSFLEKKPYNIINLDQFNINDYVVQNSPNKTILKTHCTLVLTPSQLCDQWIKEYYDKFDGSHNVILIATIEQYTNLSVSDILFADLIVMSYNVLLNPIFQASLSSYNDNHLSRSNLNKIQTTEEQKRFLILKGNMASFAGFLWRRIICDESHEILCNNKPKSVLGTINRLQSTFKWNISGTPFSRGISSFISQLSLCTDFDRVESLCVGEMTASEFLSLGFDDNLVEQCGVLYRRNTKKCVLDEVPTNIITEVTNLLEFTEQERVIYNGHLQGNGSKYSDFLLKLCCHTELFHQTREMVKKCKTLDEIQEVMLQYNKSCLTQEQRKCDQLEARIDTMIHTLLDIEENEQREQLKQNIAGCKRALTKSKKTIEEMKRTCTYLENAIHNLATVDACPICLEDFTTLPEVVITSCGHKFCWTCINELHKQQPHKFNCPNCKSKLSKDDVYVVRDTKEDNSQNPFTLQSIIGQTKSTKMGSIIHYIKTNTTPDDKIILFSQWEELLLKFCPYFEEHEIAYVHCHGNVYQRTRAIRKFQNDPNVKVILLSSNNAASGINLTSANKIIMLEPVYGTQQYRQSIEAQSIGRADRISQKRPIQVYRFIIKNTIEEDIIKNLVDENAMKRFTGLG